LNCLKIVVKNNKCNIIDLINNQIILYQRENENEKVMFCERVLFFFHLYVCMFCVCVSVGDALVKLNIVLNQYLNQILVLVTCGANTFFCDI
jgi:hypothetical protein